MAFCCWSARYRTLSEEYSSDPAIARGSQLAAALSEEGTSPNANLYVLLRGCDRYVKKPCLVCL